MLTLATKSPPGVLTNSQSHWGRNSSRNSQATRMTTRFQPGWYVEAHGLYVVQITEGMNKVRSAISGSTPDLYPDLYPDTPPA